MTHFGERTNKGIILKLTSRDTNTERERERERERGESGCVICPN